MIKKFRFSWCVIVVIVSLLVFESRGYSVSRLQRELNTEPLLPPIIADFTDKENEASLINKPNEPELVDENNNFVGRVFYNGSQVWKLPLKETQLFKELSELNKNKEISWWGGNHQHIDMLVRPSSRNYVENLLRQFNVTHEVIIPDVQQAIDSENPVFDEQQELANRKAKRIASWRLNRYGAAMGYNSLGSDMKLWPAANWGTPAPTAYRWGGKGNSAYGCAETYGGKGAFSEPESRAMRDFFMSSAANFKAYISFHSYGQYILYPWGYDRVVPPDYMDLLQVGKKAAQFEYEEAKNKLAKDVALRTPDKSLQLELDQTLEKLKDLKEHNTALQLQLDSLNNSHQLLKSCNDELTKSNQALERRLIESESHFSKMKVELRNMQDKYQVLFDSEAFLKRTVEVEKSANKSLKQQTEKDAKSIQDLTRQVKEMERIMARKHPDSVSALIVAANTNVDHNSNARQILEDRIKQLESEAQNRETHSTKMFTDIQEKFNAMKQKYETHIQDLEDHLGELKTQLNCHVERSDVSVQTATVNQDRAIGECEIGQSGIDIGIQTTSTTFKPIGKNVITKKSISATNNCGPACVNKQQDSYLLATVRGLNNEIAQKERIVLKLQKEVEELKKTNRRLQKEREGSLKSSTINISERKDNNLFSKSYNPNEYKASDEPDANNMSLQISALNDEKDKLQAQLNRLEEDYQALKLKRLQDLNTLQVAHEEELTNYMGKMTPLREQLEIQQVSIGKLQSQLATAREQITILTAERDHLDTRVKELRDTLEANRHTNDEYSSAQSNNGSEYATLRKKISQLERRYEDRELRLRAIVHELVQKQSSSRGDCEQCVIRQQQLCGYKAELDQILMTLKNHTNL